MTFLLSVALSALLHISGTLHVDTFPVTAAQITSASPVPIQCNMDSGPTIRFYWRAGQGEDVEDFDPVYIEKRLHAIAEGINGLFFRDSDRWGEVRLPRWQTTDDCRLNVGYLAYGEESPRFPLPTRQKSLIIEDDSSYCGYAFLMGDDQAGPENWHNESSRGYISRRCLGIYVVAHELLHSFGAVQQDAPHFIEGWHASDAGDIMSAYAAHDCAHDTIDCGNDDYFALSPAPDSYLAGAWNSANSQYLISIVRHTLFLPIARLEGMRHEDH